MKSRAEKKSQRAEGPYESALAPLMGGGMLQSCGKGAYLHLHALGGGGSDERNLASSLRADAEKWYSLR